MNGFVFGATRRGGPFGDIGLDAINVYEQDCTSKLMKMVFNGTWS